MALASDAHLDFAGDVVESGFLVPNSWNWKSDSDDPDLRDVVVVTDQTLFITRDMSSSAARKMLMAAAESDLAVSARAAATRRNTAIPLVDIVEVSWTTGHQKAIIHTSSGRTARIDLPNEKITAEICECIATRAGYGAKTVTDLGRPEDARPLAPAAASALICCGLAGLYTFVPPLNSAVPAPALMGSCAAMMAISAYYAVKKLQFTNERTAVTIDRRRSSVGLP